MTHSLSNLKTMDIKGMNIKELFEHERYLASISSAYLPEGVFQLLDRIEAHYNKDHAMLVRDIDTLVNTEEELRSAKHNCSIALYKAEQRIKELEAVLQEVDACARYWSEYYVPVGLPERIKNTLKQEDK